MEILSHQEVSAILNETNPERTIIQSSMKRIYHKFKATGFVNDLSKSGRPQALDVIRTSHLLFTNFKRLMVMGC